MRNGEGFLNPDFAVGLQNLPAGSDAVTGLFYAAHLELTSDRY
jgi:hypothetical protein